MILAISTTTSSMDVKSFTCSPSAPLNKIGNALINRCMNNLYNLDENGMKDYDDLAFYSTRGLTRLIIASFAVFYIFLNRFMTINSSTYLGPMIIMMERSKWPFIYNYVTSNQFEPHKSFKYLLSKLANKNFENWRSFTFIKVFFGLLYHRSHQREYIILSDIHQ